MKTYISDIIPKLQKYSQKLDNLTLLTNQHWVVINEIENAKNVYIFRSNNDLLLSTNGKVEKAKWEYLGNNTLLIDKKDESFLFKHGFFDENVLALKVDGKNEYAFLINESKYDGELNSIEKIIDFLTNAYLESSLSENIKQTTGIDFKPKQPESINKEFVVYKTKVGIFTIAPCIQLVGEKVYKDGIPAPDGKYNLGYMTHIHVKNGIIVKETLF